MQLLLHYFLPFCSSVRHRARELVPPVPVRGPDAGQEAKGLKQHLLPGGFQPGPGAVVFMCQAFLDSSGNLANRC